jgi:hypothetical protein
VPFPQAWSVRCRRATVSGLRKVAGLPARPRTGSIRQRLVAARHSRASHERSPFHCVERYAFNSAHCMTSELLVPSHACVAETLVARPYSGPRESCVMNRTTERSMACLFVPWVFSPRFVCSVRHVPPITSCLI